MDPATTPLFRQEALEQRAQAGARGSLLRMSPAWTRWSYWVVVALVGAGAVYAAVGTIHEYAMGPALIRADGRREISARAAGTVAEVAVGPGQRVRAGQALVRFHDTDEAAEVDRIEREFNLQLVKMLRDPTDQAARQTLTSLRTQKDLAAARLAERTIKAPITGVVSDVRIRPGQHLNPGDSILSLAPEDARYSVIAMLPGQYRPQLRVGMPLRLELDGYRYQYRSLTIDQVGEEVVGPAEVKRYLGPDIGDAVAVSGPVVLVQAHLPSPTFTMDGRTLRYHDGMSGRADARVRSERIVLALVPGLRALVQP